MPSSFRRMAIIVVLLIAVAGVIYLKGQKNDQPGRGEAMQQTTVETTEPVQTPAVSSSPAKAATRTEPANKKPPVAKKPPTMSRPAVQPTALPRLLELGADKCVPCKMMQPILAELRQEYAGKLQVDFIDVWENRGEGDKYNLTSIPTQIFFDTNGKEVYRHIGFYAKKDIVAKFAELGIKL